LGGGLRNAGRLGDGGRLCPKGRFVREGETRKKRRGRAILGKNRPQKKWFPAPRGKLISTTIRRDGKKRGRNRGASILPATRRGRSEEGVFALSAKRSGKKLDARRGGKEVSTSTYGVGGDLTLEDLPHYMEEGGPLFDLTPLR